MNFPELLRQEDICKIEIPRLQRDYAQGRLDKSASEIREQLLFDIFTKESVSLNIIFGDSKNGVFIPVDGQQRLTTLFLLYLYEAKLVKENHIDFTKFAYATRKSTEDFIKELILEEHSWDEKLIKTDGKLSDYIKNQHWFVWPWYHDPTVLGMLVMLDAIHEKASQYAFPDLDKIEFDFLNMGEMGLNETLYLKMNSRGKHLSAFDKIKSGLDGLLENVQDITPPHLFDKCWRMFFQRILALSDGPRVGWLVLGQIRPFGAGYAVSIFDKRFCNSFLYKPYR